MKHLVSILLVLYFMSSLAQESNINPFQVLVAKNATAHGKPLQPLQKLDDITKIKIQEDGFVSLVHSGGTTFELTDDVYTFYLKSHPSRQRKQSPEIHLLYEEEKLISNTSNNDIELLYPPLSASNQLVAEADVPLKIYWDLDKAVLNYTITIFEGDNKIQDFKTRNCEYELKPSTYGLTSNRMGFKITSDFYGEKYATPAYQVELIGASKNYEMKAADYVIKALNLESNPMVALSAWQEALEQPNGLEYVALYEKFLGRNSSELSGVQTTVEQLLSQNK